MLLFRPQRSNQDARAESLASRWNIVRTFRNTLTPWDPKTSSRGYCQETTFSSSTVCRHLLIIVQKVSATCCCRVCVCASMFICGKNAMGGYVAVGLRSRSCSGCRRWCCEFFAWNAPLGSVRCSKSSVRHFGTCHTHTHTQVVFLTMSYTCCLALSFCTP